MPILFLTLPNCCYILIYEDQDPFLLTQPSLCRLHKVKAVICMLRENIPIRGLPSMTSALEGGEGVVKKWTRVLISCVIMYVTRGEGVKKFEIFTDVIDGSPLRKQTNRP